jgi:hypothetical protein
VRTADARAREDRARAQLGAAIVEAERTYAIAVRRLVAFDEYLAAVRLSLQHAGYLSAAPRRGRAARV